MKVKFPTEKILFSLIFSHWNKTAANTAICWFNTVSLNEIEHLLQLD